MRVAVVGTGYVGLVAGACFAGIRQRCDLCRQQSDQDPTASPGQGPDLRARTRGAGHRNRAEGRLVFTTTLAKAVRDSAVVFIAVGTPQGEDGSADLNTCSKSPVTSAVR